MPGFFNLKSNGNRFQNKIQSIAINFSCLIYFRLALADEITFDEYCGLIYCRLALADVQD